jgi:hypothetical protein
LQAEVKITKIYEAVRDSVPWDITCVRTKHTVSIHCELGFVQSVIFHFIDFSFSAISLPLGTNRASLVQQPCRDSRWVRRRCAVLRI